MTEAPNALGARIRRFRKEREMLLIDLAKAASVSKGYLSELETGGSSRPSAQALLRIADALGVTLADLMGQTTVAVGRAEVPESLRAFAEEAQLPEADLQMLAGINFRGGPPVSKERWKFIYDSIRMSESMDRRSPT